MADDNDSSDKTEDPTQKRLDDAHDRGDVAKSQEINTWFVIAGGTLVLSTFSGSIGGGILMPLRNLVAPSWMRRDDRPGLNGAGAEPRIYPARGSRRAAADAGARGNRRQYGAAPAGMVGRIAQAE